MTLLKYTIMNAKLFGGILSLLIALSFLGYSIYNFISSSNSSKQIGKLVAASLLTFIALVSIFAIYIYQRKYNNLQPNETELDEITRNQTRENIPRFPTTSRGYLELFSNWYHETHPHLRQQRQQQVAREQQNEINPFLNNQEQNITNNQQEQLVPCLDRSGNHLTFQEFYIYRRRNLEEYYL